MDKLKITFMIVVIRLLRAILSRDIARSNKRAIEKIKACDDEHTNLVSQAQTFENNLTDTLNNL